MAIRPVSTSASTIFDKAREGMGRSVSKHNKAAAEMARGDFGPNPIVEMAKAEAMYGANARVIQAHDEMLGTLLDTRG